MTTPNSRDCFFLLSNLHQLDRIPCCRPHKTIRFSCTIRGGWKTGPPATGPAFLLLPRTAPSIPPQKEGRRGTSTSTRRTTSWRCDTGGPRHPSRCWIPCCLSLQSTRSPVCCCALSINHPGCPVRHSSWTAGGHRPQGVPCLRHQGG